jgi:thiamine kinase-like enzyme
MPAPGDDPVVDRATELANARVAAAAGLAPPVIYADPDRHLLVTRYVEGPTMSRSALARGDGVERVGQLLARLHRLDACRFRGRFAVATVLDRYRDRLVGDGLRLDVDDATLLRRARRLCRMLDRSAVVAPCHNDPWPANIVDAGDRLVLVDWEYSAVGDPLWDLAHFAVEADLDPDQTNRLVRTWCGRTPPRQVSARLTLWRPLTDVVWGLWAQVQHRGGNDRLDLRTYAARRLRRARHLLDDDVVAEAVRTLADVV